MSLARTVLLSLYDSFDVYEISRYLFLNDAYRSLRNGEICIEDLTNAIRCAEALEKGELFIKEAKRAINLKRIEGIVTNYDYLSEFTVDVEPNPYYMNKIYQYLNERFPDKIKEINFGEI